MPETVVTARPLAVALAQYEQTRNGAVMPVYQLTCQLAAHEPPASEMQQMNVFDLVSPLTLELELVLAELESLLDDDDSIAATIAVSATIAWWRSVGSRRRLAASDLTNDCSIIRGICSAK